MPSDRKPLLKYEKGLISSLDEALLIPYSYEIY